MDQAGWAWCGRCQGLFFSGNATQGSCPAGGAHDGSGSGRYVVDEGADPAAHPHGQDGWVWCSTCQGLFFGGNATQGSCPAGDAHDGSGSGRYTMDVEAADTPAEQQRGWRWCDRCQGLFFAGNGAGSCPAGGGHDGSASAPYVMRQEAAPPAARLLFTVPAGVLSLLKQSPEFASDQEQAVVADSSAVVTAKDGSQWCALGSWVGWPASAPSATWQCRSSQLTVTLPSARSGVQVLPFTAGFPTASLALPSGALALTPVLGASDLRLVATFGDDTAGRRAYDEAVAALSHEGAAVVTLSTSHDLTVTETTDQPAPPPVAPDPTDWKRHLLVSPDLTLAQNATSRVSAAALAAQLPVAAPVTDAVRADPVDAVRSEPVAAVRPDLVELTRPALAALRLDRPDWSRIFTGPTTPVTTTRVTTVAQTGLGTLTWHKQDEAASFPDIPHQATDGWLQIVPPGTTRSLYCRPGSRPELFYYLPTAYKLGFHAGDGGQAAPAQPFRVTMARAADDSVTITVSMTGLPYLADADRATMREYLLQNELQGTQPYVELQPASGLGATFQGDFLSEGTPVAGSSIRYALAGATSSDLLQITFTMDELDYGLLVPMLERGITGSVVLKQEDASGVTFSVAVPVELRLDDVITDALSAQLAPLPDGSSTPYSGTLTLTNRLGFPVQVGTVEVDLLCVGQASGLVLGAEQATALATPLTLAAGATSAALSYTGHLPGATVAVAVPGVVAVSGPSPHDWVATVNRVPSLQPSKVSVTLSPSVPAAHAADVRSVTVDVYAVGQTTPRQPSVEVVPGHDAPLELDLSLSELAAGVDVRNGYQLEFTTRFADDTRSLPQRLALDLTRKVVDLLVLVEPAGAQYFVDTDTTMGPMTRDLASQYIGTLRASGKTWSVRAVAPVGTTASSGGG